MYPQKQILRTSGGNCRMKSELTGENRAPEYA